MVFANVSKDAEDGGDRMLSNTYKTSRYYELEKNRPKSSSNPNLKLQT